MGKRATRAPSIVGWFFRLPSLVYAAGRVAPPACPLALAAARALSVVMRGGARNDSKRATITSEPAFVKPAGPGPRSGVPDPRRHVGRSGCPFQGRRG